MKLDHKEYNSELIRTYHLFISIAASFVIGMAVGLIALLNTKDFRAIHGLTFAFTLVALIVSFLVFIVFIVRLKSLLSLCKPSK